MDGLLESFYTLKVLSSSIKITLAEIANFSWKSELRQLKYFTGSF